VFKETPSLGISRTCLKCHISGTRFIVRGAIQLTRATSSNLPIRPTIFVSCVSLQRKLCAPFTFHLQKHFAHKTNFLRLNIKSNFQPKIRWVGFCGVVIPNEAKTQSWQGALLWNSGPSRIGSPCSDIGSLRMQRLE